MATRDQAGAAGQAEPAREQTPVPADVPAPREQVPGQLGTPPARELSGELESKRWWQPRRVKRLLELMVGRVPRRLRLPLATYLTCQLIFLFWWAAFYPGLMNRDSISFVLHVTTGRWVADHSVLYDSLVGLSLHATGDLGALTLAQTAAMSAALAYTVTAFRYLGVPGRWTAVAAVIVAALPPLGSFIVFIWKDVPFAICAYMVVPTLARLISLRGPMGWRRDRRVNRLFVVLGLEMVGMCLFRQNGFAVVMVATMILLFLMRGVRTKLVGAAMAAVGLTLVANLFVYPAAGIKRAPSVLLLAPAYSDIAVAYAERPSSFTAADKQLMARVEPLKRWKASADCYNIETASVPGFLSAATRLKRQLVSLWLRVFVRTPDLILSARLCRGSIAWRVFPGTHRAVAYQYLSRIPRGLFGTAGLKRVRDNPYRADLATRPLSDPLNKAATFLRAASETPQLDWLLWRGATWCYIAYIMIWAFAARRRNWVLLSLAAIIAAQQVVVLVQNPAQVFRYMAAPLYIGIMLIPLFLARDRDTPAPSGPAA